MSSLLIYYFRSSLRPDAIGNNILSDMWLYYPSLKEIKQNSITLPHCTRIVTLFPVKTPDSGCFFCFAAIGNLISRKEGQLTWLLFKCGTREPSGRGTPRRAAHTVRFHVDTTSSEWRRFSYVLPECALLVCLDTHLNYPFDVCNLPTGETFHVNRVFIIVT